MYSKKKKDLDGFLEELSKLQDKYKIYISADYEEQLDEGMDGEWYSMGGSVSIIYTDEEGNEIEEECGWTWKKYVKTLWSVL